MSRRTKKRGNGEGTLYQDADTWVAELTWTDENGTHRSRRRRRTQHEAIEAFERLKAERRDGRLRTGGWTKLTVAEVMRAYVIESHSRVAPRTVLDYRRIVETQIVPALGKRIASALRRKDVLGFIGGVNGERSKQYAYTVLRAGVNPYVRHADPAEHPFPPRSTPKVTKRNYVPISAKQRADLLAAIESEEFGTLFLLSIATGLRPSELFGLHWNDIGDDHIRVRCRLDEKTRTVGKTKTEGSRRRIDVPGVVIASLISHCERQRARHDALVVWKANPPTPKRRDRKSTKPPHRGSRCEPADLVFTNSRGNAIVASNIRRTWRALRIHLSLPDGVRLYDMRHEHASMLCGARVHPKVIQERLGHSSFRVTMDTYAHLMPGMQDEAVAAVSAALTPGVLVPPAVPPK